MPAELRHAKVARHEPVRRPHRRRLAAAAQPGDQVGLRLASPEAGDPADVRRARVAWVEAGEAGVVFERSDSSEPISGREAFGTAESRWRSGARGQTPGLVLPGAGR